MIIDSTLFQGQPLTGDNMRYEFQGKEPPVILKSTLPEISDTMMGHMEIEDFWKMMSREDKSLLTQRTLESGLAHAGGHPLAVQCTDLVLECIKAYDQSSRDIKTSAGNVVARLDPVSISITFRLPMREEFTEISKEAAQGDFHQNKKTCLNAIAMSWLD